MEKGLRSSIEQNISANNDQLFVSDLEYIKYTIRITVNVYFIYGLDYIYRYIFQIVIRYLQIHFIQNRICGEGEKEEEEETVGSYVYMYSYMYACVNACKRTCTCVNAYVVCVCRVCTCASIRGHMV